jgi:integrase
MGSIRRRGEKLYFAFVDIDGTERTRLARGCTRISEVKPLLAEAEMRVQRGEPGIPEPVKKEAPKLTVRALAEKFHAEAQRDVWNLADYRGGFWSDYSKNVDPYIGMCAAVEVRRTDVATWRDKMKAEGKSARAIIRGLGAASVMWNWALELGHLPDDAHNPTEGVTRPTYKPVKELYTPAEVAMLLSEAAKRAPDLHPLIACAYFTGCRKGELAALTWGDIDFESQSIIVTRQFNGRAARKNGEPVTVGLNPHLRDILGPLAGADTALVFPDPTTGKMRREHDAKRGCWGIRELADMAKVRRLKMPWHRFRNAHATALENAGATPSDIMRALGQSSIQMAMRYANASGSRARERVALIPAMGPVKADDSPKRHLRAV